MTIALHGFPDWQRSLSTADLEQSASGINIAGGFPTFTGLIDVRKYTSYAIAVTAEIQGVATQINQCEVKVIFYSDAPGLQPVYEQSWGFWAFKSGASPVKALYGKLQISDAIHGPFIQIVIVNNGVDQMTVGYTLLGHSRPVPGLYVRNSFGVSGTNTGIFRQEGFVLPLTNIGAGATIVYALPILPGRCRYRLIQTTAQNFTFLTAQNVLVEQVGPADPNRGDFIFPDEALQLQVFNAGALGQHGGSVICDWSW